LDERRRLALLLVVLGAGAASLAAVAAGPYPGVSVDSGEYLAVADGLRRGQGLTMPYAGYDEAYRIVHPGDRIPMTQFPPLYPAALAAVSEVTGLSLHASARTVGVISFAAFAVVGAFLVWRATRSLPFGALVGALLLGPDLVTIHAMVWSEQLMLAALAGALLCSVRIVDRATSPRLAALALCCVAASMARFAGVATIAAGALVVSMAVDGSRLRRLRAAALFGAATLVPTIAWFVRNTAVTGAVSEKEPAWHPPSLTVLGQAAQTIGGWIVPWRAASMSVGIVVLAAVVVAAIVRRRTLARLARGSLVDLCILYAASYALFLLLARSLLDQNIPFDQRLLAPLLALGAIGGCAFLHGMSPSTRRAAGRTALVVVASLSVLRGAALTARFSETTVAAYTSDRWRASETLAYAQGLPRTARVITNAPDPLWFWDDRVTQILPPRSSLYSGEPNDNYSAQVEELWTSTACTRAVVVFFSQPTRKPPREVDPLVVSGLRLDAPLRFSDGAVFQIDEPPCR
jgi:hypothetical protein